LPTKKVDRFPHLVGTEIPLMKPLRLLALFAALLAALAASATLTVTDLRCDWGVDPLGVDSAVPQLAWKIASSDRSVRQSAWQVRVASSLEKLAAGAADVWDGPRTEGNTQLQVAYAGRALRTGEQVFWQVRVWDATGQASDWSVPATWTMGLVHPLDWTAQWITDPELLRITRRQLGFSTPPVTDENTPQWLVLDLGQVMPVDQVVMHPLVHTVLQNLGFPRWFKVELAASADFHDATVIADHTADPIDPWLTLISLPVAQVPARYLRLTTPRLRLMADDSGKRFGRLALSQIEVRSGDRNIAIGAKVTASASLEGGLWAATAVVDGLELPGANPRATATLQLRREFAVGPGLKRATLFVSGLGQYTLMVNGAPQGAEDLLTPGWTDYSRTCLYDTRDLTTALHPGANAIGLTLASGMFNVPFAPGHYTKFVGAPRPLTAIAQLRLEYADGRVETVATDTTWKAAPGPVTFAHIFGGEEYDARLAATGWDRPGFNDAGWTPVTVIPGPGGKLRGFSSAAPPLRTHETLAPVKVTILRPGVEVYDFGQNAALMPRLRVHGPTGGRVKIIPAELLQPDGSVNWHSAHNTDTDADWRYTLAGLPGGESWRPSFFYHGARYLQVERTASAAGELPVVEQLEAVVVHTASPAAGDFACSNELFNRIRTLIRWAQRSNLVSIITDCPHRERLGWLEQYHLNGPALRCEFDLTRLYAKTFGDMTDAQLATGLVPSIAPEYVHFDGGFRDSPEWGSALILAAWQQYVWTGDDTPLRRHYAAMQRYFDYLTTRADGHIVSHGLGDWYDVGPKEPGVSQLTPIALAATAIYYEDALALSRIARHLGQTADAGRYDAQVEAIAAAFNARFFNPDTALYATGSQTAQALPYVLGLVPDIQADAVLANLVKDVRAHSNGVTAGDVGYRYLLKALAQGGRSDVIFEMTNQSEKPGYGYQLAHGATSLTEAWDTNPSSSQNHFMLGQIMEWFYLDLAGLAPDPAAPGFARLIIRPDPVGDITWAQASLETVRGKASVRWERDAAHFRLKVTVPANAGASVQFPVASDAVITEGGQPIANRPDIKPSSPVNQRPTFEIGSGTYEFEAPATKGN